VLSDGDRASLSDIAFNVDLAFRFTEGMDYQRFVICELFTQSRAVLKSFRRRRADFPWI
jgi:uncharacterized protein with HEPN domain